MFREIFQHSPVAMILVDKARIIQLANTEVARLFGYSSDELIGKPIEILVPLRSKSAHPSLVQSYLEDPTPRAMGAGRNLFGLRKNGDEIPIEVGLKPITTPEGVRILSSIIDLSFRIRAEEKFRAAFEAAPNAMIMVDGKGKIVLANDQTLQVFGYAEDELIGQAIEILVPEDVRAKHPGYVHGFVERPAARAMGTGRVLHAKRKDGSLFPVEIGLRPFSGTDGLYVIGSVVDISEVVRIRRNLEERNEELGQFTYRTSHDLKAPLISIQGLAKYIAEDIRDGAYAEATANANKIVAISGRLQSTIATILSLMKAENVNEEASAIRIDAVVERCRDNLQAWFEDKNVEFRTEFGFCGEVFSQAGRVAQVIENLLSNGLKYSDPSKSVRYVCVRAHEKGAALEIEVEDNGLGIPKNRQAEVFNIFSRFHPQSTQGSGLGLYLVKKQVQKLGGEIRFVSTSEGTRFTVVIPNGWPADGGFSKTV